jgi:hypothetical protein
VVGVPYHESQGTATVRPSSLRGNFPQVDCSPLGIINIRLKTLSPLGDPASLVHQHLQAYFPGPSERLFYSLQELDVNPDNALSIEAHQHQLDAMVNRMARYVFCHLPLLDILTRSGSAGCQRLLVFLHTHSDPDNGDLHVQHDACITAEDVGILSFTSESTSTEAIL